MIKKETYKGNTITFKKTSNYISKDFPSVTSIKMFVNGKFYSSSPTKGRALRDFKRWYNKIKGRK